MQRLLLLSAVLLPYALSGCSRLPPTDTTEPSWQWTVTHHPTEATTLVTGGTDGALYFYTGDSLFDTAHFGGIITELRWHPGGRLLAVAVQGGGRTTIYNTATGARTALDSLDEFGVRAIGWEASGSRLATGDYSGNITLYDTTGTLLAQYPTAQKGLIGLDWSPDGRTLAAVGEDLLLMNVATGTYLAIADRAEEILLLSVAYHPSGKLLATGDYGDDTHPPLLQFWDSQGNRLLRIDEARGPYRSLEWSHDGSTLAAVSDAIRLYDREGKKIGEQRVPGDRLLWGLSWAPDDRQLTVTDEGGAYRQYSTESIKQ